MKLLIVGSRTIENFDLTLHVPKEVSTVISGGAKGIDSIAERFAVKSRRATTDIFFSIL